LLWGLFSLPVIMAIDATRGRETWRRVALCLIPAACAIAWMFTEGRDFLDNKGVVSRSFANRSFFEQLWFAADQYIVHQPAIAALLVLSVISVFRAKRSFSILSLFAIPSLTTWFLIASYDIRSGVPALIVLAFLIAYGNYCLGDRKSSANVAFPPIPTLYKYAVAGLVLALSLQEATSKVNREKSTHDGYETGFALQNNLFRFFGSEAKIVFDHITANDNARLWAPTNYMYGIFYGYADVTRPVYDNGKYTSESLINELKKQNRNYATNAGELSYGPAGKILDRLVTEECPKLFTPITSSNNKYKITVYQINSELLNTAYCDH
jgi:hypothetical protein